MFRKLLEKAEAANFKAAAKRGALACPNCGAKPSAVPASTKDAITCGQCGTRASAFEWSAAASPGGHVGNPDQPPANTKIARLSDPSGSVVWNIPASGKSGGLFIFGILWCSITAMVSGTFLFGNGEFESNDVVPVQLLPILPILFFGIFWAVGLGMLYAGCRNKYAKHRLTADRDTVTLRRELFGKAKDKSLPTESIASIAKVEFYQRNYQPVHGIEIKGSRGKLRFGSVLTEDEKAWLVADLRRVTLGAPAPQERPAQSTGARQSYFSFPLPKTCNNLWPLAILLTLMGVGFIGAGIFLIDQDTGLAEKDAPGFVRAFDFFFKTMSQSFRLIWTLMSGVMAAGGLSLLVWLYKTRDQETRIEGTDSEIAIRTSRHGLVLKERAFPRPSVADIRSSVSGSSNGKTMKRVELIVANKAEPVARWIDGEKADELVDQVRRVL